MLALDVQIPSQAIPVDPHYMILPIDQGFDWAASFEGIAAGDWYLVVFRSKHRAGANEALLTDLDNAASESARELPGFLHYFIGTPLATGDCLSFCLWNSREEAAFASAQPAHRAAVMQGIAHYEYYALERYAVRKRDGVVTFERL